MGALDGGGNGAMLGPFIRHIGRDSMRIVKARKWVKEAAQLPPLKDIPVPEPMIGEDIEMEDEE